MLANLVVFLSASVAVLALLDFLLSEGQKETISDRVTRMWNWLDETKRVPVLDILRTPRSQSAFVGVIVCAAIGPMLYLSLSSGFLEVPVRLLSTAVIAILTVAWFGRKIISVIMKGRTALQLFGRLSLVFVPVIVFWVFLNENPMRLMKWFGLDVQSPEGLIFGAAFLVTFGLLVASNVLVLFWLASAGLVLFIYLGSLILVVAEFTMRRIAEYPKGPILAGSVALGSITALIKAFW
jgi:hypothetical protein